jgi:hypothetical protein
MIIVSKYMVATIVQEFTSGRYNFVPGSILSICIESKFLAICHTSEHEGRIKNLQFRSTESKPGMVPFDVLA